MRVLVLGSGVIGTTVAYYLAASGHEVTVVDRQPGPALETSYANAGEVSPGYSAPWAGPGVPLKAIKWLLMQHQPAGDPAGARPRDVALGLRDARATAPRRAYRVNKSRMVPSGRVQPRLPASVARRDWHRATTSARRARCNCSARRSSSTASARTSRSCSSTACPSSCSTATASCSVEPALAHDAAQVRRCAAAARRRDRRLLQVHAAAREAGAEARRDVPLRRQHPAARGRAASRITGVHTDAGLLTADRTCWRSAAIRRACSRRSVIELPVYPVKGYSITVPITDASCAPESTIMDETHKVAVTRLGDRIRVGGTARAVGLRPDAAPSARRRTLEHVVTDLFPRGGDVSRAEFWTGLRPMTPDGTPIVGADPDRQPLPDHRPRHARLDDGGRHRARDGRPDQRSRARDQPRGPGPCALRPRGHDAGGRRRRPATIPRLNFAHLHPPGLPGLTVSRKVATRAEAGPGAPPSKSASTNRMASSTSVGTLKIFGRLASRRKLGQHHRHQHECRSGLNAGKGRL